MELLLNLVWVVTSALALLAWVSWPKSSPSDAAPQMVRGVIVIFSVTALLFPVISMSDDLSQIPGLAESNRIQDILKAPELRAVYHLSAILPEVLLPFRPDSSNVGRNAGTEYSISRYEMFWSPSVEKRPPPYA